MKRLVLVVALVFGLFLVGCCQQNNSYQLVNQELDSATRRGQIGGFLLNGNLATGEITKIIIYDK